MTDEIDLIHIGGATFGDVPLGTEDLQDVTWPQVDELYWRVVDGPLQQTIGVNGEWGTGRTSLIGS